VILETQRRRLREDRWPARRFGQFHLDFIPSYRVNDVVYLDPSDMSIIHFILILWNWQQQFKSSFRHQGIVGDFFGVNCGWKLWGLAAWVYFLWEIQFWFSIESKLPADTFNQQARALASLPYSGSDWWKLLVNEFERCLTAVCSGFWNVKPFRSVTAHSIPHFIGTAKLTWLIWKCMNKGKIVILNLSQGKWRRQFQLLASALIDYR